MKQPDVVLPPGYRLAFFNRVESTNAEALRRAEGGEAGGLWVWALEQSAGRGRAGRRWASPRGNLFASLLLRPACGLETALQLVLVAGLALHDAVDGARRGSALLKWPNDLLLAGRKSGGILLESVGSAADEDATVVIGTGLNLASHPADALKPATDLASHGIELTPREGFERLARATARRLEIWRDGAGFDRIRADWEARALPVGQDIRVRAGDGDRMGTYLGIDCTGALRLRDADGREHRITTGDVFLSAPVRG